MHPDTHAPWSSVRGYCRRNMCACVHTTGSAVDAGSQFEHLVEHVGGGADFDPFDGIAATWGRPVSHRQQEPPRCTQCAGPTARKRVVLGQHDVVTGRPTPTAPPPLLALNVVDQKPSRWLLHPSHPRTIAIPSTDITATYRLVGLLLQNTGHYTAMLCDATDSIWRLYDGMAPMRGLGTPCQPPEHNTLPAGYWPVVLIYSVSPPAATE